MTEQGSGFEEENIQQFGMKEAGIEYKDRPGAYALIIREDGLIAAVAGAYALPGNLHLPGGGIDESEDLEECLKREVQEEMGRTVQSLSSVGKAKQYSKGGVNKICNYYRVELVPGVETSDVDSTTYWVTVEEFEKRAVHEAHVWAVKEFLAK